MDYETCSSCNGLGSYEYWGTYYRCPVCGGKGYLEPPIEEVRDLYHEEIDRRLEEGEIPDAA